MSRLVVLGGGVCRLASAMMLARDGDEVVVLEPTRLRVPESAEEARESWERDGVKQFRMGHFPWPAGGRCWTVSCRTWSRHCRPPARFGSICWRACRRWSSIGAARGRCTVRDAHRPPTGARAGARLIGATADPRLEVRRGVTVTGLTSKLYDGTPHVTGVRLESGAQIGADLVVDAMGRRSRLPQWLLEVGARPVPEQSEDCGFIYYQRMFRSTDGSLPTPMAPINSPLGAISLLTLPADNGTWAVVVAISSGDRPLKRLRDADR